MTSVLTDFELAAVRTRMLAAGAEVGPRLEDDPRADSKEALAAVERGAANLRRHLGIVKTFGLPCVVAVNRRPGDTETPQGSPD